MPWDPEGDNRSTAAIRSLLNRRGAGRRVRPVALLAPHLVKCRVEPLDQPAPLFVHQPPPALDLLPLLPLACTVGGNRLFAHHPRDTHEDDRNESAMAAVRQRSG